MLSCVAVFVAALVVCLYSSECLKCVCQKGVVRVCQCVGGYGFRWLLGRFRCLFLFDLALGPVRRRGAAAAFWWR